jgi:exosortase
METEFSRKPSGNAPFSEADHTLGVRQKEAADMRQRAIQWLFVVLPFLFLWGVLINQLRVEWQVNPQYSYGWVVPLLCLALVLPRWQEARQGRNEIAKISGQAFDLGSPTSAPWLIVVIFASLAFLWLPTRLFQEANPEWRLVSWALGVEVVAMTLCAISLDKGQGWMRQVAFPICFFLVAVPWPTPVEATVIQSLTRLNSAVVIEVLGWFGIPAIQHGNLIEVATGTVGIDEACSGIRSLQSTLMVSLFLGEFYRMSGWRRWGLLPVGFILAMALNVCRMSFLTIVAAKKGVAAIAQYHDPAGVTIALACTVGLWGLALLFSKKLKSETLKTEIGGQISASQKSEPPPPSVLRPLSSNLCLPTSDLRPPTSDLCPPTSVFRPLTSSLFPLSLALLAWLVLVEAGVESWYRWHEARLPKSVVWSVEWPRSNATYSELKLSPKTQQLLRYDAGGSGVWREADGTLWQMIYLRWLPGRIAVYLAKTHTPDVCLPAAGRTVEANPDLEYLPVNGLRLPFRTYTMNETGRTSYVFYCLWQDRALERFFQKMDLSDYGNRLSAVSEGKRNLGQRSLEIIISGYADFAQAKTALMRQLQTMIKIDKREGN